MGGREGRKKQELEKEDRVESRSGWGFCLSRAGAGNGRLESMSGDHVWAAKSSEARQGSTPRPCASAVKC